jgi:drug/metabolite transporter (DMT)-like permease
MFAAASRMPLADATAISFLSPLVTMIAAIVFLGDRVGAIRWTAAGISVVGALILIRPGTEAFQPAAAIALAAALFMGLEAVLIKRLSDSEPPARILLVNNAMGSAIAISAALFVWVPPSLAQIGLMALLGVTMLLAQSLFIQAMKGEDASYVIPFFYATLVFATLYDFVLFGDLPDGWGATGAAIILAGSLLLALRDRKAQRSAR